MKIFRKILDFILFRHSFEIETETDQERIYEKIRERCNIDKSFLSPVFEKNKFAFSHKNFMPAIYNFNLIIFEGKIVRKEKTSVSISATIQTFFIWIYIFAVLVSLIGYVTNMGGMKNEFQDTPFPVNPLYSPIFMLIPYTYYAFKISDVKAIIRNIIKREERQQKL